MNKIKEGDFVRLKGFCDGRTMIVGAILYDHDAGFEMAHCYYEENKIIYHEEIHVSALTLLVKHCW